MRASPFPNPGNPEKKLRARSWVHADDWPRIFLSELLIGELSDWAQEILTGVTAQIPADPEPGPASFWSGRLWEPVTHEVYLALRAESEYAAWLVALGLRPNHFTVHVNALDSFRGLGSLLDFVAEQGFALNESGGRIKGSVEVGLEQGSTMADRIEVEFADGAFEIPTCYYEFALRHPVGAGLYDGFVAASADRIFESTHAQGTT